MHYALLVIEIQDQSDVDKQRAWSSAKYTLASTLSTCKACDKIAENLLVFDLENAFGGLCTVVVALQSGNIPFRVLLLPEKPNWIRSL